MRSLFLCLLAALTVSFARAEEKPTLLANGDFEASKDGKPTAWGLGKAAAWEKDGDNHFLRLTTHSVDDQILVHRAVPLSADIKALKLTYKVRYEGIQRGKQNFHDGRILMNFRDAAKEIVKPGPSHPNFVGNSKGWKERTQLIRVPAGAVTLEMLFTLFNAKAGQLDFDDITLVPIDLKVIEDTEAEAAAKDAARIAKLPKPKPQVPVPAADQLPPELRVEGNKLKTKDGKTVQLQGVAIPSMEWSAGGEHILESIDVAIRDWKVNCVRLPIRENFWIGKGPYQNDGGMKYRQLVDDAVNACAGNGVYIVLDLHEYRAPQEKHVEFWKKLAEKYGNHSAVLFDLLNEPHDISWKVWRDGGPVTDEKKKGDTPAENTQKLVRFQSVGMQKLVDTVREQKARNIVIAGGLDWGYDLSGILDGHALDDRGGNGVMYSSHVYPWKSDWKAKFLDVAAKHPVFLGEVGADTTRMEFIPPERQEDPYTWVPDMLGTIQKHNLNWTAWNFHPKSTPRVILDWKYEPTPFWGAFVKRALAGEKFEANKTR